MSDGIPGGERGPQVPRRVVLGTGLGTGAGASAGALLPLRPRAAAQSVPATEPGATIRIRLTVNGRPAELEIDSRASLLDLLRERLGLTGTKKGCDHGQCGACTVHLGERSVVSCLTLAAKADGGRVTTIEGLAPDGTLHPLQRAFIDHDALQCGYCTPGQIMSAAILVRDGRATGAEAVREFMSGNLCRCGAYAGIVAAILSVAETREG
ncbi:(2Fe-2S)-binding protein [Pararoseomonas sp. SCSIO 73927]|uniref:(2Fe-2S)-binding protein n=1 Tax=Pararoseomonas sp. SCSIO 73927 TaxID=3114537 RepID=UPI0030D04FB3